MSYLATYAKRNPPIRGHGLDERLTLNLPGFHGGAYVRVFVEDTSEAKWRGTLPEPRIRLRIADCQNEIALWFELGSAPERDNSLHKIETLLGALQRFRDALWIEAHICERREWSRPRRGSKAAV
jgi:hypothetical protein